MAGWGAQLRTKAQVIVNRPEFPLGAVDWNRLVTVDFESFWDADYTLKKMSTSEYVRDPRFKAQMVGIKIGDKPTKVYPANKLKAALLGINWGTHSLLCHNTAFDGFIMSHVFGIKPVKYYDTLSMARGLHSNEIGAGLDEVAQFYGKGSKLEGVLETTKGIREWDKAMIARVSPYCAQDVDLTYEIFKEMHVKFPADELELINMTIRMFCDPVLKVDIPRVEKEYEREVERREKLFFTTVNPDDYDIGGRLYDQAYHKKSLIKGPAERALEGTERRMHIVKRVIGNNEKFADLLRAEGIQEIPIKPSPAYIKMSKEEKLEVPEEDKFVYAFSKDDTKFTSLPDNIDLWRGKLDPNKKADVPKISAKQDRIRQLVECRLAVKSTTNITRAERFLKAGADGMSLPVGYAYYRAHTGRWGGNNKMNMQNLTRGGELRLSILAPKGYQMCVVDSGQIEARVNGWLWGQRDLMDAFRTADKWDKSRGVARGDDRDAYCRFGDLVYGREITTEDKTERFVGKVCLGSDTVVLTNRGLKSIVEVRSNDLLWDGDSWVNHDGLVNQGKRSVITYRGLSATPDHEILTEHGWLEWQEVLTDPSLIQSALSSANLLWSVGNIMSPRMESLGGTDLSADAHAAPRTWSTLVASEQDALLDAMHAQKSQQAQNATGFTGMLCRMTNIALACLTVCRRQLAGAVIRTSAHINIMANGASQCILAGFKTERSFCDLYRLYLDGMIPNLSSIASITMAAMPRAMCDSRLKLSTPRISERSKTLSGGSVSLSRKTQTYDLANAGPNRRFTVMTEDGPVIVHNCVLGLGFQMGAPKFQMTLAKGALGGPPVFFSESECQDIVNKYRRANYKIADGWKICQQIIKDMATGRVGRYWPISWEKEKIWLPNGMSLKYPDLRCAISEKGWEEWSYQAGDTRSKIYGGLLCENIVQALARIIVAWQMLQIDKKYRIVMTTHDEAVALPKTREAQKCFEYMTKIMSTPPSWCSDIPLNCEGGFAENYSK